MKHLKSILSYRKRGYTLQEIGDKYGVTRERVRQVIKGFDPGKNNYKRNIRMAIEYSRKHPYKSNNEIFEITGVSRKTLSKYIGVRHIIPRDKIGKRAEAAERLVSQKLNELNIGNKLMPTGHPFDILLDSGIKIDVKFTGKRRSKTKWGNRRLMWGIGVKRNHADFFICVTPEKDMFIIPVEITPAATTFIIFTYPKYERRGRISRYIKYKDRFDLLKNEAP